MIIVFSGIDGSGKTTQAQYVAELLQQKGQQVQYIHMIRWTLVNRLGRLIQPKNTPKYKNAQNQSVSRKFASIRWIVSLLDILRFRIFCLYQTNIRRRIIVCDRFFYDLGVQSLYIGVMNSHQEHLYWKMIPSPTISILLDIPPEIGQQREAEHNLSYYQRKRELYLQRVAVWGTVVVDVSEMEETRQNIENILYTQLDIYS